MKSVRTHAVLALFAAIAGMAYAGSPHESGQRQPAINPQPLPPRHDGATAADVINPQPLPPRRRVANARDAINPQPLPPRTSDSAQRASSAMPYIGETERN